MKNTNRKIEDKDINIWDIYKLWNHYLLCWDSTNKSQVDDFIKSAQMDSKEKLSIRSILTDPPYWVAYVENKKWFHKWNNNHSEIINDQEQTWDEYEWFTCNWLDVIKANLSDYNSYYIFNSDKMLFALKDWIIKSWWYFSQLLIWVKTQAVIWRMDYLPQHELIAYWWFWKHKFHKSKDKSVLVCPKPGKSKIHPTMKPISLLRRLILNSTEINDIIYDPFWWSWSTLLACEQTKRRCLMIELDPKYCNAIIARWEKLTSNKSIKIN